MNALVLSGGSIKGAFQAGALTHLIRAGFVPEMVYGISVGGLNGAFLADRSGRAVTAGEPVDWLRIAVDLERFWIERITRPADVIRERGAFAVALAIVRNRFNGMVSTQPLHDLVRSEADRKNIARSPLDFYVGAVNMISGEIAYIGKDSPQIVDFIIASTAMPVSMPLVTIGGEPFYDGGIRDIAPLGRAINSGATRIVAIICQPEVVERRVFDTGRVLQLLSRTMDIVANEIILNDLKIIKRLNRLLASAGPGSPVAGRYDRIPALAIWPDRAIPVEIDSFSTKDVRMMLELGRESAQKALDANPEWVAESLE
jgi:NTE family protein